ncbi:TPA: hypothetical protein HA338_00145 [Methanosarcina acetivorans]|uniref:Uncharacterized protein n=1 Tax=Methanosarcina acetivorans TaxID=2214 RepID=A0A832S7Y8_9EURY|nr:hypothetical protein [Methanosarcina acetivorans]HIH92504.1 hypothetical protein [Methanosarcina acetivorans]
MVTNYYIRAIVSIWPGDFGQGLPVTPAIQVLEISYLGFESQERNTSTNRGRDLSHY